MAYTEKYFHQFCKPSGKVCRISIQKRDYVGSSIELEGQPEPISITYENSDEFKFKGIIPSTAEIFLTFGTGNGVDFDEFWESDEKTFKIVYTVDGEIEWVGFVLLEGFAYELAGGVYYAQITATDGLGTLESILFKDQNTGQKYGLTDLTYNDGFKFPLILVATEILRKLELDIDLWTLIDVYEQNQIDRTSNSRNSDPLAITYVNVKTYINGTTRKDIPYYQEVDEAWNCKKVMENLLNVWGANLYQEKGTWRIIRPDIDGKYGIDNPILLQNGNYFYKATYTDDVSSYSSEIDAVYDTDLDIYSSVDNSSIVLGSVFYIESSLTTTANEGYYKLFSLGKIVKLDLNGSVTNIYNYTPPVYNWHKYNTLSGYIGGEPLNNTVVIPCNNSEQFLLGNDHVLRMDDLYKQFRVNYEYAYLKDGDSPDNLIKNGNFEQNYTQYGGIEAPPNWRRVIWGSKTWYPRLRVDDIPLNERIYANGETKMLTMGYQYNNLNTSNKTSGPITKNALGQNGIVINNTVNESIISIWIKYTYAVGKIRYYPTFRIFFASQNNCAMLVNDFVDEYDARWLNNFYTRNIKRYSDGSIDLKYSEPEHNLPSFITPPSFFYLTGKKAENYIEEEKGDYKWYNYKIRVPKFPDVGQIAIYIHGLTASRGAYSHQPFLISASQNKTVKLYTPYGTPNFNLGSINWGFVSTKEEEIPSEDYIYANENINYTDQRDPIEIFNGDTEDVTIQSSLIVPANNTEGKNKWDTSNNDFGKSDLGLILCKTIMAQYSRPSKLLEGGIKVNNATYGSRFYFDAIPNVYWKLLRGKFNPIRGYIEDATFAQISNESIKKGGVINGDTLDPLWLPTGNIRCVKELGLNTGFYEEEEQDSNRNSETFGVLRWVLGGEDNVLCPLNEPSKYYWGCDDSSFELSNMTDYTVLLDENGLVSVNYNQEGGKYIYFIHLASIGTVNRVANDFQYNIIDSFQYLSDITINGYLYRVLRQDFVTSEMTDFSQTFDFN